MLDANKLFAFITISIEIRFSLKQNFSIKSFVHFQNETNRMPHDISAKTDITNMIRGDKTTVQISSRVNIAIHSEFS